MISSIYAITTAFSLILFLILSNILSTTHSLKFITFPTIIISTLKLITTIPKYKTLHPSKLLSCSTFVIIEFIALYFITEVLLHNSLPFVLIITSISATFAIFINETQLHITHIPIFFIISTIFNSISLFESFNVDGIYLYKKDIEFNILTKCRMNTVLAIIFICLRLFTLSNKTFGIYFSDTEFTTALIRFCGAVVYVLCNLDGVMNEGRCLNLLGVCACIFLGVVVVFMFRLGRIWVSKQVVCIIVCCMVAHMWFVLGGIKKTRLDEELLYPYLVMMGVHFAGLIVIAANVGYFSTPQETSDNS